MSVWSLPEQDQSALLQCMTAIAENQWIEDWEFDARLGLNRKALQAVISCWPDIDDSSAESDGFLAINNCMNEICHGLRISPGEWDRWFTMSKSQIEDSYRTWSRLRGRSSTGLR